MFKKRILVSIMIVLLSSLMLVGATRNERVDAPVKLNLTIVEGQSLSALISCYDSDGDTVVLTAEDLPVGVTVSSAIEEPNGYTDPNHPNPPAPEDMDTVKWFTSNLNWTPSYTQSGSYTIYIHAEDDAGGDDWARIIVTVINSNRPPVL